MASMCKAVRAPANLAEVVRAAFARARRDGALHFFPSRVTLLPVGSAVFQLRYSAALANKPAAGEAKSDPFADPAAELVVGEVGAAHILVLNKFVVVAEHLILATKAFAPQWHLLEAADLEATRACLAAYDGGLFAFFNSGRHSGASQAHRHVQLMPLAAMADGLGDEGAAGWRVLAGQAELLERLPFVAVSEPISLAMPATELHATYLRLYGRACDALAAAATAEGGKEEGLDGGDGGGEAARISYNLAMTANHMVVCPRRADSDTLRAPSDGRVIGRLAVNGTVLAGTALVKTEAEWLALRDEPQALADALVHTGVPREEGRRGRGSGSTADDGLGGTGRKDTSKTY